MLSCWAMDPLLLFLSFRCPHPIISDSFFLEYFSSLSLIPVPLSLSLPTLWLTRSCPIDPQCLVSLVLTCMLSWGVLSEALMQHLAVPFKVLSSFTCWIPLISACHPSSVSSAWWTTWPYTVYHPPLSLLHFFIPDVFPSPCLRPSAFPHAPYHSISLSPSFFIL